MNKGKFITLEGAEGVGKTTNLLCVRQYLEQQGMVVSETREPGGTPTAEAIRALLINQQVDALSDITELLLMFAARTQHLEHFILPELEKGHWVLSDRFTDATYAYQGGGRNVSIQSIEWLENLVQGQLRPDLTLLLDAPVETGMKRAKNRGQLDRFENEQIAFFERVRESYLKRAQQDPTRIKVIDASQTITRVQQDIQAQLAIFLTN